MECVVSTCRFRRLPCESQPSFTAMSVHIKNQRASKKRASAETYGSGSSVASRSRSRLGTRWNFRHKGSPRRFFFFFKTAWADSETWLLGPRCCLLRPWHYEHLIHLQFLFADDRLCDRLDDNSPHSLKLSGSLTTRVQLVDCMDVTGSPLRRVTDT